jgi:tRNA-uridine aminocarboxypropyltransferase
MSASAAVVSHCPRCFYQTRVCLCADVPVVATRTRIVIVRHRQEQHRSSNTGRLASLALPNSVVVEYGTTPLTALDGAWLVYPLGEPTVTAPVPPPRQLVVLDATWSQARRMYRKLAAVRGLPILRLPDDVMVAARLRESPAPGHVSTIEAIARALRLVEGDEVAAPLERLFDVAVARAKATGRLNKT